MTQDDVQRIFNCNENFICGIGIIVSVNAFINVAGFKDCEPTKAAMLVFDGGTKGYYDLIMSLSE